MRLFLLILMSMLLTVTAHAEDEAYSNKYAVIWSWAKSEDKRELITDNLAEQASATLDLWKSGRIENVYMDTEEGEGDEVGFRFDDESGFLFFIKARDEEEAKNVLSEMPFVKLELASYTLYEVGLLWLKQYEDQSE